MRFIGSALIAATAVLVVSAALAQSGGLTIAVVDSEGLPLPGATVTIGSEMGHVKTTAQLSNKNGQVVFPVLRPSEGYWVEVSFPGFAPQRLGDLRVRIGENPTMRVQMIAEMQETVKVTAQREVVNLETTEQVTKFSDEFISDLPVPGRSYTNVLTMAPGVQDADGDGNPNVHGSRNRDFSAMVSGVRNVDPLTGQRMSEVNPNSIEEMEVITAGASVEFGRAQGGFANIVQKQGSNEHEGVFEFYWRTSKLDGTGAADFSNLPDPDFERIQPSIHLSGPLMRDKLWYSLSQQYWKREDPVNVTSRIEVVERTAVSSSNKLTWQVSPRNKLAFQYQADPFEINNFGVSATVPSTAAQRLETRSDAYTMTWTAPFSPKILVESIVAWQDLNSKILPNSVGVTNDCFVNQPQQFLEGAQCTNLDTGQVSGSYWRVSEDQRQRLTVSGKATVFAGQFLGANHTFKLGIGIENERYFRDLERNPQVFFLNVNTPNEDPDGMGGSDPQPFSLGFFRVAIPQNDSVRATGTNWTLWGEDEFKPTQNLSVRLGLRLDREETSAEGRSAVQAIDEFSTFLSAQQNPQGSSADSYTNIFTKYEDVIAFTAAMQGLVCEGEPAESIGNCLTKVSESVQTQDLNNIVNGRRAEDLTIQNTNVSPRFSVAWSPWSNGKTAFKLAGGRFYNNLPLTIPLIELEPALTDIVYRVQNNVATPDGGISPKISIQTVDPNLKTPYQDEFTFAIDRELWAETSIHLEYVNRKFRDQIQDINLNVNTGDFGRCLQMGVADTTSPHPWIEDSPGSGFLIQDPYTGQFYEDTDPGLGDGVLDDCTGEVTSVNLNSQGGGEPPGGGGPGNDDNNFATLQRPDGRQDLYIQNPAWGDIFYVGNFNQIDYEAWQVRLVRRQYRSWEMQASYTWSEAIGDGEDFFQELGDDPSLKGNLTGFQSYDVTHSVKLIASTITPWGLRLGTFITWQSGLPFSILLQQRALDAIPSPTIDDTPFKSGGARTRQNYPTGVRNDQRNISFWNVDLKATKELNLGRGLNMQLSAEIFNLLNDGTYQVYNGFTERGQQINGVNTDGGFRFGRQWQLGMKLAW